MRHCAQHPAVASEKSKSDVTADEAMQRALPPLLARLFARSYVIWSLKRAPRSATGGAVVQSAFRLGLR